MTTAGGPRPHALDGALDGMLDPARRWLIGARCLPSPHCNARPASPGGAPRIDLVVLHGISLPLGRFGTGAIEALFTGTLDPGADPSFAPLRGLQVSAHLLIDRRGELAQFVPFPERAWHAGRSAFGGRPECNDYSIGIELEGTDQIPYTDPQYASLIPVLRCLMRAWPGIQPGRIVGHCDIAPGRKTDPGPAFDWSRLRTALASPAG
jgi:AmpD protein